jgi:hypothetical protein
MRWRMTLMAAAIAASPVAANAVTPQSFSVHTTADLVATCDTPRGDPMHVAAINFCEGFIAGAYQFHQAEQSGPRGRMLFCLPRDGSLTMDQAVRMFVQWAQRDPQYMQERPVDSLVRFATATFPCGK